MLCYITTGYSFGSAVNTNLYLILRAVLLIILCMYDLYNSEIKRTLYYYKDPPEAWADPFPEMGSAQFKKNRNQNT